ncbi:hypothetical protein GCM10007938_40490 [Vibrio zhanjiangensis]|uniref:DUF2860 domain-containing protein n=1 Tax=Vibrio zhanjiangensis TaxID=1046128 RepID=A0ABQ6F626_9VIBR|nr:DUF2860 domain-containing protein [Vibrio zhanjiangensis]GLT20266.1 hypothetical protein GCM10007938_40490 [Vibrio zhanjiangensis]
MKTKLSLLAVALFASSAHAQLAEHAGFSGEFALSAGFASTTSNLNTDGDKVISNVNQEASDDSGSIVYPLGHLAYTFGAQSDKQFYLGTSREDIAVGNLVLELGYKQQLESGTVIDASFLPTIMSGETWADPFLTNQERETTDEKGNAFRLKFDKIMGSRFSLDTVYANREIENEQSGTNASLTTEQQNALKRDAKSIYVKGSYRQPISRVSFLQPSIIYINTDADGEANSLKSVGGELTYFRILDHHQLALTAGYTSNSYDGTNPIYGKVRDEDELSFFAAYEYKNFMGWQNWSLVSLAGFSESDSNIDFYDTKQYLFTLGMNYKF